MKILTKALLLIWAYMTCGIWMTYHFQTLMSPIAFTAIGLIFLIVFANCVTDETGGLE